MSLSFGTISELPISAVRDTEELPFAGRATVASMATGTPSLVRVSSGDAVVSTSAVGTMRVIVLASGDAIVELTAAGTPNFVLYAANREFISRPTDQIANQPILGTLERNIQFDHSIVGQNGFDAVTLGWGEITLINADGYYDFVIRRYVAGRRVVLKMGIEGAAYDSYFIVFDGIASGVHVEKGVVRIYLRDGTYKLETPAQSKVYGGTGGLDGTEELRGKRAPRSFGYCRNVKPAFVSPTLKLFQVHDGSVQAISAVYSQGKAVTFDQDYPTAADLMVATVTPGRYATCIAAGLFRVNFILEGDITADVEGDNADGFVSTSADIVRRLLSSVIGVPGDLDVFSFNTVNTLQPAPIGYYLDEASEAKIADVIADIMGKIGGYGGFQREGKFEVQLFRAPSGVPSARYDRTDIIDIKREKLPDGISPPPYRYRIAWGRNYFVQTGAGVAGDVSDDRRAFLEQQYRLASSLDADSAQIISDYPQAQDPSVVEGYFRDEADAAAEAQRLLNLYGKSSFSLYRITLKQRPFVHRIGDLVMVTYPRWDLIDGRLLRVVSISERFETNEVEIMGFG